VVLVVGGAGGIGAAIVPIGFIAGGIMVALLNRNQTPVDPVGSAGEASWSERDGRH